MSPVVVADYETAAMVLVSKISKHLSRLMRPSAKGVMLFFIFYLCSKAPPNKQMLQIAGSAFAMLTA